MLPVLLVWDVLASAVGVPHSHPDMAGSDNTYTQDFCFCLLPRHIFATPKHLALPAHACSRCTEHPRGQPGCSGSPDPAEHTMKHPQCDACMQQRARGQHCSVQPQITQQKASGPAAPQRSAAGAAIPATRSELLLLACSENRAKPSSPLCCHTRGKGFLLHLP